MGTDFVHSLYYNDFTYVGEMKRSWNSRGSEHKPGIRNNRESAIKVHAETTDHDISINHVQILQKNVDNWQKRIFLEWVALHTKE